MKIVDARVRVVSASKFFFDSYNPDFDIASSRQLMRELFQGLESYYSETCP